MKPITISCFVNLFAMLAIAVPVAADPREAEVPIPPGMHGCCTIDVDDMSGLSGLKPNDRVDVYGTFLVDKQTKTVPIAQNAKVLSINRQAEKISGSVFVLLPYKDAMKLNLARQQGKVTVQIAGEPPRQPAIEKIPKPTETVKEPVVRRIIDPKTRRVIFTNSAQSEQQIEVWRSCIDDSDCESIGVGSCNHISANKASKRELLKAFEPGPLDEMNFHDVQCLNGKEAGGELVSSFKTRCKDRLCVFETTNPAAKKIQISPYRLVY